MTRHMLANLLLAFVFAAVAAVKATRIVLDEIDDATCRWVGLS